MVFARGYQVCMAIFICGGLLSLLYFLMLSLIRKVRSKPQGRCLRGIICSVMSILVGFGGMVIFNYQLAWFLGIKPPDLANTPGTLTKIGQVAPDFDIATIDGNRMKLSDLRGKVVVLNFFATWCGPCMTELPYLEKNVWQVFKDKPFALVVIGQEETEEKLKSFRQEHGFTFPMAADPDKIVYAKYATKSIPRTYVISPEGVIVYQVAGFNDSVEFYKSENNKMIQMIHKLF
jgi:peroxiredoxin